LGVLLWTGKGDYMKVKKITVDELLTRIMDTYETLDGDELAEEYNRLFPGQPVGYDGEGIFSRSITDIPKERVCTLCGAADEGTRQGCTSCSACASDF